jgi:hypothetical protein
MLPTNTSPLNDQFIRLQIEEHQAEIRRSIASGRVAHVSSPGRLARLVYRNLREHWGRYSAAWSTGRQHRDHQVTL